MMIKMMKTTDTEKQMRGAQTQNKSVFIAFIPFTLAIALLVFLALTTTVFAQTEFEKTLSDKTTSATGPGIGEVFRDWRVLSILAIMVSIVLVGIGYMVGISFEMPEIKAWAGNEVVQVFTNVLIVITLVVVIALIDAVMHEAIQNSGIVVPCTGGQSCLGNVSVAYLQGYIDIAKQDAERAAIDSIEMAGLANRRFGLYCSSILCLQVGASGSILGNYLLDQDRYNLVFEYYSNLLASLEAQKFFVEHIAFNAGPLILAAGIVGRSFFFTRKLGGLLIAVAAGMMFFLPGMYVFDWVSLDTTLTGDKANADSADTICPGECRTTHALAVVEDGSVEGIKLGSIKAVYDAFPESQVFTAQGILNGTVSSGVPESGEYDGNNIISCMGISDAECPLSCRELPYPTSLTNCMNQSAHIQQNCARLPYKCWVRRLAAYIPPDNTTLTTCPLECKVVAPLNGSCDTGNCLASRPDCRIYLRINNTGNPTRDFEWAPDPPEDISGDQKRRCEWSQDCTVSPNAYDTCSYIIPDTSSCAAMCNGCPEICRIETNDSTMIPDSCIDPNTHELYTTCQYCPSGCKVNTTYIKTIPIQDGKCSDCAAERRIVTYGETMPDEYITGDCDMITACPAENRVLVPRTACEQCVYSDESDIYNPPIRANCADLCKPSDEVPTKSADSYTKVGSEGLYGKPEIANVSKLMLPAYVLPLFNLVATLVFIRGLSNVLGGDIEIPGISKVF